jgi:hypothetical protein
LIQPLRLFSLTAFANANRNCSYVSGTARSLLTGLRNTGRADRKAEMGNGSTPRNGAGSMATAAAASPRPAMIRASKPPKDADDGRRAVQFADHRRQVVRHVADGFVCEALRVRGGFLDGLGIIRPAR